jgi:hypothetical protein
MKIIEMLPELDEKSLATVLANAVRLSQQGNPKQKEQALGALPLIEAEQTRRAELAPTPVRAKRAKASPTPAKSATKTRAAPVKKS